MEEESKDEKEGSGSDAVSACLVVDSHCLYKDSSGRCRPIGQNYARRQVLAVLQIGRCVRIVVVLIAWYVISVDQVHSTVVHGYRDNVDTVDIVTAVIITLIITIDGPCTLLLCLGSCKL